RAEHVAIALPEAKDKGGASLPLRLQHAVFDKLVYSKLRAALGGKVAWAVSGAAPLGARLGHFYRGIGVPILKGWRLTEKPSPGVTIRIAPDGEILMRGDNVYGGYWHNAKATGETVIDGWFHTGDIGEIDDEGFVKITGRKKELIVTAGGKNVAPAVLEDR